MPFAGDIIYATDLDAIRPTTYTKVGTEGRASNVTLADDAELAGIPLGVGTWEIDVLLYWFNVTTATQGLKTQWGFTGTWAPLIRTCLGPGVSASPAAADRLTQVSSQGARENANAVYNVAAGSSYSAVREISRTVTVTASGNFSVKWAQNASSANATSVAGQSSVTVRQIA